ncbi:MAG: acyl carrier protein [Clostridia bacterium]|nr:acyl carrier protein [Clostridia bacterium]
MFERVQEVLADQLGLEENEIKPESKLKEDLGADSLDMVELIMAMEEEFDVEIPDEEAQNIRTVEDAVNYVEQYETK